MIRIIDSTTQSFNLRLQSTTLLMAFNSNEFDQNWNEIVTQNNENKSGLQRDILTGLGTCPLLFLLLFVLLLLFFKLLLCVLPLRAYSCVKMRCVRNILYERELWNFSVNDWKLIFFWFWWVQSLYIELQFYYEIVIFLWNAKVSYKWDEWKLNLACIWFLIWFYA